MNATDPTDVLFASKALELTWLPLTFHSPCFVSGGWFWRVDSLFGAWVVRAIATAKARSLELPASEVSSAAIVRNYLEEQREGAWTECEQLATSGPIKLPSEICAVHDEFARFEFFPAQGLDKYEQRPEAAISLREKPEERAAETVAPLTSPPKAAPKPKPATGRPRQPVESPSLF